MESRKNELSKLIDEAMEKKGLLQVDVAELIDVTPEHLSRLRHGKVDRPKKRYARILRGVLNEI